MLGPHAGTPGGAIEGMPVEDLLQAWNAPFDSDDPQLSGCPALPVPPPPPLPPHAQRVQAKLRWEREMERDYFVEAALERESEGEMRKNLNEVKRI